MMMDTSDQAPAPPPQTTINYPAAQSAGDAAKESSAASLQAFKDALASGVYGDYAQQLTDIQAKQAPQLAQQQLDQTKLFGPQIIAATTDLLKQADPTRFAIQQTLSQKALDDLKSGGNLTPQETEQAQQDARAAYEAKGIRTSIPAALGEVGALNQLRSQKEQQRFINASSVLAGQQPSSIFGAAGQANSLAPTQTQSVNGIANNFSPNATALLNYQQNQFGQLSQNAAGQAQFGNNQYQFGIQNSTNPFMTGVGVVGGLAATAAGAF